MDDASFSSFSVFFAFSFSSLFSGCPLWLPSFYGKNALFLPYTCQVPLRGLGLCILALLVQFSGPQHVYCALAPIEIYLPQGTSRGPFGFPCWDMRSPQAVGLPAPGFPRIPLDGLFSPFHLCAFSSMMALGPHYTSRGMGICTEFIRGSSPSSPCIWWSLLRPFLGLLLALLSFEEEADLGGRLFPATRLVCHFLLGAHALELWSPSREFDLLMLCFQGAQHWVLEVGVCLRGTCSCGAPQFSAGSATLHLAHPFGPVPVTYWVLGVQGFYTGGVAGWDNI